MTIIVMENGIQQTVYTETCQLRPLRDHPKVYALSFQVILHA